MNNIIMAKRNQMSPQKALLIIANCLIMLIICFTSSGQNIKEINKQDKYRAIHWGLDNGLSEGQTYTILKDINGFLWIGTRGGLNRFDGSTFKIYTHQKNNSKSLISNHVIAGLVEDSLHNIWIGSEDRGVSRYNIKTDDFTNFYPDSLNKYDVATINPFWATKNEVICFERSLIISYNIHTYQKKILSNLLKNDMNSSLFDNHTNTVWGLVQNPKGNMSLLGVNIHNKTIDSFPLPHYTKSTYFDAEAMCLDEKRNCIWINGNEGLLRFTLSDKLFHHIPALSKYEHQNGYGRFVGITQDLKGRVWFATHPSGIVIYNPDDESVNFPFPADSATQFATGDVNACLYCDRNGIIWSGFWLKKGIDAIVPFNPVVKHYPTSPKKDSLNGFIVVAAKDAGAHNIWVGCRLGMQVLNTETGKFTALQSKNLPGMDASEFISPVLIDTIKQKAVLTNGGGIFNMDMRTKRCTPVTFKYLHNDTIPDPGRISVDGDKAFFSAWYKNTTHISVLNLHSDTAYEILTFPGHPFNIWRTFPVANRYLFLAQSNDVKSNRTYENKNGNWTGIQTPIDSILWTNIFYEKEKGSFWVAGENQLFRFDRNFHLIKTYSEDDGLPELPLEGLVSDNNGNIWLHTDRSILELNVATGQIKTMSEAEGYQKEQFESLPYVDKDAAGNIYYCGGVFGSGLDQISPNNFAPVVSNVYLKSLNINHNPFSLKISINYTDSLSLRYNQSNIEIETGIIDFYSQGKSRLRYKLESGGTKSDWQYAPYYYTIRYEGLNPGSYKLLMQASNASNEFNGPVRSLLIFISPAFWDTWWFRIAAVMAFGFMLYGLIRWRLQQKFRLRLERSEKEIQFAEIKQKASELEMQALRAQMNPHFIFNSLNSINRFILQNNRVQASEYLTKFSKLVRMILQNSQSSLITLESELESLGLYLEMEALRFDYHFDYKVSLPKDIDIEVLKVPPLILQPYVENAIWHGLMHKEEKGLLNIEVTQDDDHLFFKIRDNGIGRKKATELASKSATKHKSMGLRITAHRIAMMNHSNGLESPVRINDLVDKSGNAEGTEVIIKMPMLYD
jgi:ligand-binding sensor domain-containing protein